MCVCVQNGVREVERDFENEMKNENKKLKIKNKKLKKFVVRATICVGYPVLI